MARVFRDLPRHQTWLLISGCCAYVGAILAIGLFASGFSLVEDNRSRQIEAKKAEPKPPSDLRQVPEVALYRIPANEQQARPQLAQLVQKIRSDDAQDADGFVKGLIQGRADLQGLPFIMGGACR